ncbi:MAG TPA: hypothetical protein DCS05_06360, partial [Nitrospiraceae bacterium]|nr:hypothetical protein [Nitrospiraceae bacterium]
MRSRITAVLAVVVLAVSLFTTPAMAADPALKPFVLGSSGPGTIDAKLAEVKAALALEGFEVVGEYTPYKGAHVVVVTSEALRNNAAKSGFGAYGAAQRISLTETAKGLQIAYTNPLYMAQAYRMKDGLADVAAAMEKALGKKNEFGSEIGITAGKLRKYHYMMMMPYFTDPIKLAAYPTQEEALQAVEANLATGKGGAFKVYRVDLTGKKESVFGVGLTEGGGADGAIMKVIDQGELKQTAHLPYELIVSDGKVFMLHGKFRIAVNFPDLTMGTFMKISGAPSAIED